MKWLNFFEAVGLDRTAKLSKALEYKEEDIKMFAKLMRQKNEH